MFLVFFPWVQGIALIYLWSGAPGKKILSVLEKSAKAGTGRGHLGGDFDLGRGAGVSGVAGTQTSKEMAILRQRGKGLAGVPQVKS